MKLNKFIKSLNAGNFKKAIFVLFFLMLLTALLDWQYPAEYLAAWLYYFLALWLIIPVFVSIFGRAKKTLAAAFLKRKLRRYGIKEEQYDNLLGPILLKEKL